MENAATAVRPRRNPLPAWVWSLVWLFVVLLGWQGLSHYKLVNPIFLSSPLEIVVSAYSLVKSGEFFEHLRQSAYVYVIGVVTGCIAGAILGMAMGWWRRFGDIVDPYVVFFSAMPRVALYPVFIMLMGVGNLSRILIVFIGVMFPMLFNAYVGAKQTPRHLLEVAQVFGYRRHEIFVRVVFPASLPYLMAGFRNGVTLGMILVVVSEFFGAPGGLGQQIAVTAQFFQTSFMYAWVLYTSLLALVFVKLTDWLERKVLWWS
jgi:NitT/TauT family transport system permease protein